MHHKKDSVFTQKKKTQPLPTTFQQVLHTHSHSQHYSSSGHSVPSNSANNTQTLQSAPRATNGALGQPGPSRHQQGRT